MIPYRYSCLLFFFVLAAVLAGATLFKKAPAASVISSQIMLKFGMIVLQIHASIDRIEIRFF